MDDIAFNDRNKSGVSRDNRIMNHMGDCKYGEEKLSSLHALAKLYENSDSDTEESDLKVDEASDKRDVQDTGKEILTGYRAPKKVDSSSDEVDSEDSSSSSSSSSSDSDDSSESDSDDSSDDDDDIDKNHSNGKNQSGTTILKKKQLKGEFDDLPPIEELKITVPEILCDILGEVGWTVEQMVVVRPKPGKPTLNLDTVLFVDRGRRVLGRVFDVFGQVSEPHYCVRFNSSDHIEKSEVKVGMTVYYCPNSPHTTLVFLHELVKMKATDELGDDEPPEFSDDEEEQAYYEMQLQKQRNNRANVQRSDVPHKRKRGNHFQPGKGWQSKHPWSNEWRAQNCDNRGNQPCGERSLWSRPSDVPQNPYPPQNLWPPAFPNNPWSPPVFQNNAWPPRPAGTTPPISGRCEDFTSSQTPPPGTERSSEHRNSYDQSRYSYENPAHNAIPISDFPRTFGTPPPRFSPGYEHFVNYPRAPFSPLPGRVPHMGALWHPPPPPPSPQSSSQSQQQQPPQNIGVSLLTPPPPPPPPPPYT